LRRRKADAKARSHEPIGVAPAPGSKRAALGTEGEGVQPPCPSTPFMARAPDGGLPAASIRLAESDARPAEVKPK